MAAVVGADGVVRGTAFFVGPDLAVTCDHVLVDAGAGPVRLQTVGSRRVDPVFDEVRDPDLDLAMLRVATRPDRATVAFDADVGVEASVASHGFGRDHPITRHPDGYPMDPVPISGRTTANYQGHTVDVLVAAEAGVTNGMSGAPLMHVQTGSVVGVIRFTDRNPKGAQQDDAFAIPAAAALARWPRLLPVGAGQPTFAGVTGTHPPPEALVTAAWPVFDPDVMHVVVVGSESQSAESWKRLEYVVDDVLLNDGETDGIWTSFLGARRGAVLVSGAGRDLPDKRITQVNLTVLDAFANQAALDLAVRLVVEADLVLFDVTGFEPGVMLLLGVRAAARRGVSIASHGGSWLEGEWLQRPFNLSDLALSSHTSFEVPAGEDRRVRPLAHRIRSGFDQLARHPSYRDLPVYDALRQLGSAQDAWDTIRMEEEVLVLCSYAASYQPTWYVLSRSLARALKSELAVTETPKVRRMQDIPTPQLVSQSLYERVRRCAGCVADWTGSSPSTFFELGVRMTVTTWNVVQIVQREWMTTSVDGENLGHRQLALMRDLFDPIVYATGEQDEVGRRIAARLHGLKEGHVADSRGHRVRHVASAALGVVEERLPGLVEQLRDEADALRAANVNRDIPQALFYDVRDIKTDREKAALERRLAAWFYLEHRADAGRLDPSDPNRVLWRELGNVVCKDLYDAGEDDLADRISGRLENGEAP